MGLSGVVRTSKMAKALAKNGWNVVVLSATPKVYLTYDETLLQELIETGVHIYSTPSKTPPKQDSSSPGWFENNHEADVRTSLFSGFRNQMEAHGNSCRRWNHE